jgi:hypothetical protein
MCSDSKFLLLTCTLSISGFIRRDFDHIEYKLSYGYRQLEVLRTTGVTGASSFTVYRSEELTTTKISIENTVQPLLNKKE